MRFHSIQLEVGSKRFSPLCCEREQSVTAHVSFWILNSYGNVGISSSLFLLLFFFFRVWSVSEANVWSLHSSVNVFWNHEACFLIYPCILAEFILTCFPPSSSLLSWLFISNCFQRHCNRRLVITVWLSFPQVIPCLCVSKHNLTVQFTIWLSDTGKEKSQREFNRICILLISQTIFSRWS